MAQYKVLNGQNIWDISLILYGSIEGALDLFVSNPKLSMTSELHAGDILNYHEGLSINPALVKALDKDGIVPANSERNVYFKHTDAPIRMIGKVPADLNFVTFRVAGEGDIIVDWGDNAALEVIHLSEKPALVGHYFDCKVDKRRLKLYGDFKFSLLDLSTFHGSFYPITPIIVDSFVSQENKGDLNCLFLFKGVAEVDLSYSQINSLKPLYDYGRKIDDTYNGLQILNLGGVRFDDISILDNYLIFLAGSKTHGVRRPCTVYLTTEPSERGMQAIQTILANPQWNQEGFASSWKFYINDTLYTTK